MSLSDNIKDQPLLTFRTNKVKYEKRGTGKYSQKSSRVAGTMVARSSSVRAIARSNPSQVPPLHMHVGK